MLMQRYEKGKVKRETGNEFLSSKQKIHLKTTAAQRKEGKKEKTKKEKQTDRQIDRQIDRQTNRQSLVIIGYWKQDKSLSTTFKYLFQDLLTTLGIQQ